MSPIRATWKDGKIVPEGPVDWPEGCELEVRPMNGTGEKLGLDESEWDDSPEALAEWDEWMKTIGVPEYTPEELAERERFRAEMKRFNIEAVRRQMGLEPPS